MTVTETKPDKAEKAKAVALKRVGRQATKLSSTREKARNERDTMDVEILAAREAGCTYREIAAVSQVSTAWVQASLARSGYATQPR